MIGITLVCAAGMSTSMLVKKMQEQAKQQNLEVEIRAVSDSHFKAYVDKTNVLLLGPQISFLLSNMKKTYEPKGIKVAAIALTDYGTMNGANVLKMALEMMEQ